jgi:capsule polysaccharide export protein KpsE/RkpR
MRAPPTIMAAFLDGSWFRHPWRRRLAFLAFAVVAGLLALWPKHYLAEAQLLPEDSSGGLSAALAQGGGGGGSLASLSSLIGNKQPVEADLTIARSEVVINDILDRLRSSGIFRDQSHDEAAKRLRKKLTLVSIRGSILQISVKDRDPAVAKTIAAAAAGAIQSRLTQLNLEQTAEKRAVAANRVQDAADQLLRAQAKLEQFRVAHKLGAPPQQLGVAVGLLATLQGQVQAKQVEISSLRKFEGPDNINLQAAETELAALRQQVAQAQVAADRSSSNLAYMASENADYFNLYRDERAAEILYEVYRKYMEQVTIDALSANENMVLMQPAYVHPERQFNIQFVGLLVIILIVGFSAEFYVAAPPVGRRPATAT